MHVTFVKKSRCNIKRKFMQHQEFIVTTLNASLCNECNITNLQVQHCNITNIIFATSQKKSHISNFTETCCNMLKWIKNCRQWGRADGAPSRSSPIGTMNHGRRSCRHKWWCSRSSFIPGRRRRPLRLGEVRAVAVGAIRDIGEEHAAALG